MTTAAHPPTQAQLDQRSRLLQQLAIGLMLLNLSGVLIDVFGIIRIDYSLWINFGALGADVLCWWFARRRQLFPAVVLLFASFSLVLGFNFVIGDQATSTFYALLPFFLLQILATALLFDSRAVLYTTFAICLLFPLLWLLPNQTQVSAMLTIGLILTLATGGITWMLVRQLERSVTEAQNRAKELAESQAQLQAQATELQERTMEAEAMQQASSAALTALQAASNERDDLARSLQEATLPLMPVHEQVVVLPLVGSIDSQRAAMLSETILREIEHSRARVVIIDVTGVPLVDTHVAQALLRAAQATQLLGAHTVLVGIRPEVAQTIVGLGVDLGAITVRSNLQSGIQAAMQLVTRATANHS